MNLQDPDFIRFTDAFKSGGKYFGKQLSVDIFKLLKYLPFDMPDVAVVKQTFVVIRNYTLARVKEHSETFNSGESWINEAYIIFKTYVFIHPMY